MSDAVSQNISTRRPSVAIARTRVSQDASFPESSCTVRRKRYSPAMSGVNTVAARFAGMGMRAVEPGASATVSQR